MHSSFPCQLKYAEDDVTTAEGDRDQLSSTTTVCRHDGTELLYTKDHGDDQALAIAR